MSYTCELVRDLLPLYLDGVCSEESRRIVEEHLRECSGCRETFEMMRNDELEHAVREEKNEVIRRQAGYFKRKSAVAGTVIAGIFMIPVLVCLIVNLASGHGLSWFYIVFCSLLVASSLTVVPLMIPENKGLWTLGTFTGSLILLLAVVSIFTRRAFFFTAAAAVLFAFSVVFLPAVIHTKPVKALDIPRKGFFVMCIDTALFLLLLFTATMQKGSFAGFLRALRVASPFVGFVWVVFLVLYLPKGGKLIKTGVLFILFGALVFFTEFIVNVMLGIAGSLPVFSPSVWTPDTIDGNIKWIVLLAAAAVGLLFILAGLIAKRTGGKNR